MLSHMSPLWSVVAWISLISLWKWKSVAKCFVVFEQERPEGHEIVNLLFSLGPNWCVVFHCKLSETLQVQTPAVPPGPCHPPRLVGKPKAREVQLRWGESFPSNSDLCGLHSSSCWCTYLSCELPQSSEHWLCSLYYIVVCTLIFVYYYVFFLGNPLWSILTYKHCLDKFPRSPSGGRRQSSVLLQHRSEWATVWGQQGGLPGSRAGLLCGRLNAWQNLQLPAQGSE